MGIMKTLKKMRAPMQLQRIYHAYSDRGFRLLDIGCGNHSPSQTKKWFPACEYYGVDNRVYNNDENDFEVMEKFYEIDLIKEIGRLDEIPDDFFDVVIFSHVIEHLPNGLDVLLKLGDKIKAEGKIYIEFPSVRSLSLPSMIGSLHFCDDPSHVRVYEVSEIVNILLSENFKIIRAGRRRNIIKAAFAPMRIVLDLLRYKKIYGANFWDIAGFADYVYAEKRQTVE